MTKLLKFRRVDTGFSSYQRDWEEFEQQNNPVALNVLLVLHNSEKIKPAYCKCIYNKRKNQIMLLMINDEAINCYYSAAKGLSELNSLGCWRGKKEGIINGDNDFQNADVLNYLTTEKDPQRISKLKLIINKYNWRGINFPVTPKDWKKFELNNKTVALNVLYIHVIQKQ